MRCLLCYVAFPLVIRYLVLVRYVDSLFCCVRSGFVKRYVCAFVVGCYVGYLRCCTRFRLPAVHRLPVYVTVTVAFYVGLFRWVVTVYVVRCWFYVLRFMPVRSVRYRLLLPFVCRLFGLRLPACCLRFCGCYVRSAVRYYWFCGSVTAVVITLRLLRSLCVLPLFTAITLRGLRFGLLYPRSRVFVCSLHLRVVYTVCGLRCGFGLRWFLRLVAVAVGCVYLLPLFLVYALDALPLDGYVYLFHLFTAVAFPTGRSRTLIHHPTRLLDAFLRLPYSCGSVLARWFDSALLVLGSGCVC